MKIHIKLFAAIVATVVSCVAVAATPEFLTTPNGVRYGVIPGNPAMPMVLVLTTDIHDSLAGTFTSISQTLSNAGYTIAAIDVICHGKDVRFDETAGLDCWAHRVKAEKQDAFAKMVANASAVISDIGNKKIAQNTSVVALGVSRGGYAALRVAAADPRVNRLVLMAPVTKLERLDEFKGMAVDDSIYGLERDAHIFSDDHIFMQIGNADTRVGTAEALAFEREVVAAAGDRLDDFTTVITPLRGHGTAMHNEAAKWVMKSYAAMNDGTTRAP